MKIVRVGPEHRIPAGGDLFIGTVQRQNVVTEEDSKEVRVGVVTFLEGAVNKMHSHTFDQVLVITEGEGIIQREGEPEKRVTPGDVIFIPSGERHWHGAAPGKTMSHMTVATPGTTSM
jgi:quercetin dioxygenase-like cupin family protein